MQDHYSQLVTANLEKIFSKSADTLAVNLPAARDSDAYVFRAFGETCRLSPSAINFNNKKTESVLGILISLYALKANAEPCLQAPFRAFKELPNSMPYAGAFVTHIQQILVPHVEKLKNRIDLITATFNTDPVAPATSGDFSFRLQPLPKIWLEFICYLPDQDFPASVTCLYSQNADRFLSTDALADVGEYTAKKIMTML